MNIVFLFKISLRNISNFSARTQRTQTLFQKTNSEFFVSSNHNDISTSRKFQHYLIVQQRQPQYCDTQELKAK